MAHHVSVGFWRCIIFVMQVFVSLSMLGVAFVFFVSFQFMRSNFCDSLLSLESLLGIFLLRSWARQGVLSLYMGVFSLVNRNLCGLVVVSLSIQSPMSYSLPPMQLQRPLTSLRIMLTMEL